MKKINWQQKRWLPVAVVVGIIILVVTVSNKKPPGVKGSIDNRPLVTTHLVQPAKLKPQVIGYGKVRPKETWDAVAEVSGRVIYRHPELEKGKALRAGTELLRIDPLDYQLKLAQTKSDLTSAKAELDKLELEQTRLNNALSIERRRLDILRKELKRKEDLNKTGALSTSLLEQERQGLLAQQQKVLELETSVALMPNNKEVAKAKIQVAQSRVKEAERKLEKTRIILPFDARINAVNIERDQVVTEREVMVKSHRWDKMEIATQVSLPDMRALISHVRRDAPQEGELPDIARLGLDADVILYIGAHKAHWQAKVTRVGDSIDTQGNTLVLMVEVEQGLSFDPIQKPPLINEMYVEVVVSGPEISMLAVPSRSVHGDSLYLMDESNKLVKREVEVGLVLGELTVIDKGIKTGDKIILDDVIPAVPGMALREQVVAPAQPNEQAGQPR